MPAPYNPRDITEEELASLRRSLVELGTIEPMLVNLRTSNIIDGHQRLKAALAENLETFPTTFVDVDKTTEMIMNAALNRIRGHFVDADLGAMLQTIVDQGGAVDQTGFTDNELSRLLGALTDEEKTPWNADTSPEILEAYRQWSGEFLAQYEALSAVGAPPLQGVTPALALYYFIRAYRAGDAYPRYLSHAFHPHQSRVKGGTSSSRVEWLAKVAGGASRPQGLQFLCNGSAPSGITIFASGLKAAGGGVAQDFPAEIARNYYNELCPDGGSVLDPSHGWGGRAVGFLLSGRARRYVGVDPSPETNAGVCALLKKFAKVLAEWGIPKTWEVISLPFEEFTTVERFDFAFTSPPYFDVEEYVGGKQSHEKFQSFEAWDSGFYRVMMERVHELLKPGAAFVLQVGSQRYPLRERGLLHAREVGFVIEEQRDSIVSANATDTSAETAECAIVLRKRRLLMNSTRAA
jgi:hypothetical protein